MSYFRKKEEEEEECTRVWIIGYTHIYMEQLEALPFKEQKKLFEKLAKLAKTVNLNKKERSEYEESLRVYRDNQGVLDSKPSFRIRPSARGAAKSSCPTLLSGRGR